MTPVEEYVLRRENSSLHEQVQSQQELIEKQAQQIAQLTAQVEELHARLSKDSHNSHVPPSSDRFVRQPKSLRNKRGRNQEASQVYWLLGTSVRKFDTLAFPTYLSG